MDYDQQETQTHESDQWDPIDLEQLPKWPKVIGVISIVIASLGLTCGGIGLAMAPLAPKFMEAALEGDPVPYGMTVTATDFIIGGTGLLLSTLLLFSGIAAVTRRPVTRPMHLTYAIVAIPITIWSMLNQFNKAALNEQWAKDFPNNPMAAGMDPSQNPASQIGLIVGLTLGIGLGVGIPLFYLIWFGLIKTKPEQITGGDEGIY